MEAVPCACMEHHQRSVGTKVEGRHTQNYHLPSQSPLPKKELRLKVDKVA